MMRILWTALISYFPCKINYALISLSSLGHLTSNIPQRMLSILMHPTVMSHLWIAVTRINYS